MLHVVRSELQDKIEQEKKLLQEEICLVNKQIVHEPAPLIPNNISVESIEQTPEKQNRNISSVVLLLSVISIGIALSYFYFTSIYKNGSSSTTTTTSSPAQQPSAKEETAKTNSVSSTENTTPTQTDVAEHANSNVPSIPATNAVYNVPRTGTENSLRITESKVRNDLVGKKISGCGVTINSSDEVEQLGNLVFVETLPSGYKKYKFTAKIIQHGEAYTAVPYIYYTAKGGFIKIDGTNCE